MNKKHLSVVMAGAMLATTVAPVLAADRTVNDSNKGLLIEELRNKILSKSFEDLENNRKKEDTSSKLDRDGVHKSVYAVEVKAAALKSDVDYSTKTVKVNNKATGVINEVNRILAANGMAKLNKTAFTTSQNKSTNKLDVIASNEFYTIKVETNANYKNSIDTVTATTQKISKVTFSPKTLIFDEGNTVNPGIEAMEETLKIAPKGTTIKVWNRGFEEADGKVYNHYLKDDMSKAPKYDETSMARVAADFAKKPSDPTRGNYSDAVHNVTYKNGELTIEVRKAASETTYTEVKCKVGDVQLDLSRAYNKDNELITTINNNWGNFDHFGLKVNGQYRAGKNIPRTLVETIEVSDVAKAEGIALSNVYDGLFLTSNGEELLEAMKNYDAKDNYEVSVPLSVTSDRGLYSIDVVFEKTIKVAGMEKAKTIKEVVTITSNNQAQLECFRKGIRNFRYGQRSFPAQILAGSNRYATAIKVAEENAGIDKVAKNGNIVLVNGNALVDGLAAAPLAASVCNLKDNANGTPSINEDKNYVAPILLTDANGIPKETRDYMKKVIGEQQIKNLDRVTVYLVGGNAVISPAVENDLKEMGLRVVRAGGADREETSLEVAKLMNKQEVANTVNEKAAFLVGADGEADAMSIASVAAATKTPIVVESRHGISDDSLDFFKKYKKDAANYRDVVIVGGEAVVSKETAEKLEAKSIDVDRIAGSNRQKTNALVIDAFYGVRGRITSIGTVNPGHRFDNVVVSKDGQRNKAELIDALTATSLATKHNAPIVLGTNKLAKEQINTLELNANRDGVYIYQVGNGVARDVVKTIAERIGLAFK